MNKALAVFAILIGLIGIVWLGQGLGYIHGSVMTNDSKWAIIGGALIAVSFGIFIFGRRRSN
jgi:hypothetical protein